MKAARTRYRLLCGTWEPVAPMQREKRKWRSHKRKSTEAEHRGGATRSSDEGSVMELERRGSTIQVGLEHNWKQEDVHGTSQTISNQ
jgi:hypothetical protein